MHIHFIQHEVFEAPGAYLDWARERNYKVSFSKVYEGSELLRQGDDIDLLIVLGGPQCPDTTKAECKHFDAKAEVSVVKKAIDKGKAVVGVCLGSQLIGEAYGAKYSHSPEKEIGVFPIRLTEDGLKDEKISHFGSILKVGHWHNDMPGLTTDSKVLAFSEGCPRQIVSYSKIVYGFQCHMEITKEVAELLIRADAEILKNNSKYKFVQTPEDIRDYDYQEMNNKLKIFLDKLIEVYRERK